MGEGFFQRSYFAHMHRRFEVFFCALTSKNLNLFFLPSSSFIYSLSYTNFSIPLCLLTFFSTFVLWCFHPPLFRPTLSSSSFPPPTNFCPAQAATPTHTVHITYEEKVSKILLTIIKHYTYYSHYVHIYSLNEDFAFCFIHNLSQPWFPWRIGKQNCCSPARCWSLFPACII